MSSFGRALGVLRTGSRLFKNGPGRITSRKASGGPHIEPQYRQYPQLTKKQKFESELISGAMWFWILWHCWHDPDAVLMLLHGQTKSSVSQQMTKNKITHEGFKLFGKSCYEKQTSASPKLEEILKVLCEC
ncbi:unnamed protein product [Menidia menidia]|uniref:NADH dehydrogenase [ubiquinone] 1 beta subcomplex subunit 2, mitochondrial n=1 Tax=Menidia menidia TaxID=238744 RepID=A0A8S4B0F5_9TELE|nr:unnamed protein product [Menidia menidia]